MKKIEKLVMSVVFLCLDIAEEDLVMWYIFLIGLILVVVVILAWLCSKILAGK